MRIAPDPEYSRGEAEKQREEGEGIEDEPAKALHGGIVPWQGVMAQ